MVIDLTGVATSCIAGFFGVLSVLLPAVVNARMKDTAAAAALGEAVRNSLGAMQQAGTVAAQTLAPHVSIPGVPDRLAPAVQYVIANAGDEADRLGITPEGIAGKVLAQVGLAEIKTNQAVASSSIPASPPPLGPVPVVTPIGPGRGNLP
jgi:hypothetical protein